MKENKLQILQQTNIRRGTIFVHVNLIALTSDAMTKPVQLQMKNAHDEYIQIHQKGKQNNSVFEEIALVPFTAYLVKPKKNKIFVCRQNEALF